MAYVDILKNEAGKADAPGGQRIELRAGGEELRSPSAGKIPVTDLASAVVRISPRLAAAGMDSQLYVAPELQAEAVTLDMTARGADRVQSGGQRRQIRMF